MKAKMDRNRLTLPEVLVLIGVIVFAIVLLLPVQRLPREKARRVNCAGNLKQVGMALLMYSGNHDGYFVNANANSPRHGNFEPLAMGKYILEGKVWACPSRSEVLTLCSNSAYRYIGSGLKDDNAQATSVSLAYDEAGNHQKRRNTWMNVLMVDGHVEGGKPGSKPWLVND